MHGHHHDHPHSDAAKHSHGEPFTPNEIAYFQAEDRSAAKAIISLMLGVFSLGLSGAVTICLITRG